MFGFMNAFKPKPKPIVPAPKLPSQPAPSLPSGPTS